PGGGNGRSGLQGPQPRSALANDASSSTDASVACHLAHRPTVGDDRQDCLVPLLSHAHLLHARERDKSAEVAVTHQPKVCNASAEGLLRPVSRTCTLIWCRGPDLNRRHLDFQSSALPS